MKQAIEAGDKDIVGAVVRGKAFLSGHPAAILK